MNTDVTPWALVTGASAGIGEEFCRQLAAGGYHLVLVARREDRLRSLANELRDKHGTTSLILPTDLSERGACAAIASRLDREEVHIEFLVNNAGYGLPGRFVDSQWSKQEDFIQLMVTAVCELTHHLLPAMQKAKKGYVINVSSVAGLVPASESHTLYGASKSFLIYFSETLALENIFHSVNVSALCPGFTYSDFHDVNGTREMMNKLPKSIWLNAEQVVAYGIDSVIRRKPRVIAIPGIYYRILIKLMRYLPGIGRLMVKRTASRFRKLD